VAMISIGALYSLFPRLFGVERMYSTRLIEWHFWTSTIGTVLYIVAMWIAGVMQGLMWRTFNEDGTLTYTFIEVLQFTYPYYGLRLFGGIVFTSGMFLMVWNVYKTWQMAPKRTEEVPVPAAAHA